MVLLKLKRINFIKKIASKVYSQIPDNNKFSSKFLLKRFVLHLILICIIGLFALPISKIDGLNPLTHAFKDLTFSDIYFSRIRNGSIADTSSSQIIIVNIGRNGRVETRKNLSNFLNRINQNPNTRPKTIGIDILFKSNSKDSLVDENLSKSLKSNNIVSICNVKELTINSKTVLVKDPSIKKFSNQNSPGYANQWLEPDRPKTERYFKPKCKLKNGYVDHITLSIIENYNEKIYKNFLQNKNLEEPYLINFRGKYNSTNKLSISDTINLEILKDKILLIGLYENDSYGNPIYTEDTHWVPTNKNYFGRSDRNMYGIEIQAHIIASIINNDFISHNILFNNIFQFFISLLIYLLMLRFYLKNKTKYVFIKLFMQIFIVIFLIILSIFQIHWFNLYLDYTFITICAFISAEIISIIELILNKYYLRVKAFITNRFSKSEVQH